MVSDFGTGNCEDGHPLMPGIPGAMPWPVPKTSKNNGSFWPATAINSHQNWITQGSLILFQVPFGSVKIAMENGPFLDGLPINSMVIFHGYV